MIEIKCNSCFFEISSEDSMITINSVTKLTGFCNFAEVEKYYEDKIVLHYCSKECMQSDFHNYSLPIRDQKLYCDCENCTKVFPKGVIVISEEFGCPACGCDNYGK